MEDRNLKLEELKICVEQLYHIDDFVFKVSTLHFTVNSGLLVVIASMDISELDIYLILGICFVGYFSSISLFLISYKLDHYGWMANMKRLRELEKTLGFDISIVYEAFIKDSLWKRISIKNIRDFFNLVFVFIWIIITIYFSFKFHLTKYAYFLFMFLFVAPLIYNFVYISYERN